MGEEIGRHRSLDAHDISAFIGSFELDSIDLERLDEVAALRSRFDRKYVLSPADGTDFLAALFGGAHHHWAVLDVENRRQFDYRSLYFDHSLSLFWAHVRSRRLRFKVRTRTYGANSGAVLEIKTRDGRGHTMKFRIQRTDNLPRLTEEERTWVDRQLVSLGLTPCANVLVPSAEIRYQRMTLVDAQAHERITIDLHVTAGWPASETTVPVLGDACVIEIKSNHVRTPPVAIMQQLGMRAVSMSKYCAGLATLDPGLDQGVRRVGIRELERRAQRRASNISRTR